MHETEARVLNISRIGIAIQLPEPLPELANVRLKSTAHGLDGSGVVRRCKFTGLHYVVGLDFEDVVWTPPPGPAPAFTTLSGEVRDPQGEALDPKDHLVRSG